MTLANKGLMFSRERYHGAFWPKSFLIAAGSIEVFALAFTADRLLPIHRDSFCAIARH